MNTRFKTSKKFSRKEDLSFIDFIEDRISSLKECNRIGTAMNYNRAKSSLQNYLQGKDVKFDEITNYFIDNYNDWLMKRGMLRNSASFHMRILRAVYNKGVKKGFAIQSYPFKGVYTGIDATPKRYLEIRTLKRMIALDLSENEDLELARDMFFFSIYSRGMSFVDMVYLRRQNIEGGMLMYARKKTGKILRVRIEKEMKIIIDRYQKRFPSSSFVFPILSEEGNPQTYYRQYTSALTIFNGRLKKLADMAGLSVKPSSYTARHTWASLARRMDIPISVISESMGHRSENTTLIYLASLENSLVDKANRRILQHLGSLLS